MATIIQIKRSSGTTAPSTLKLGELAYTYGTGTQGNNGDRLFVGEGGVDGNGDANNITVIGGQYFTDKLDHVDGTLTASSALLVDSNKAIDEFIVGNSATVGGTIKFNEGSNNGSNFIALKAPNNISGSTNTTFTLPDGDGSAGQFLKTDGSGNLSFDTITQNLSIAADTGTNDSVSTGETITFTGGEGIDTAVTNNTITISAEDASDTNKGVATFNSADFAVSSGDVTIKSGGVTNTQLAGSIANAKLVNSSITIGSDTVSLGATQTDLNGITSLDVDNITIDGNTVSTTNSNGDLVLDPNGTGDVDVNSHKIINVATPTADTDAANKSYVDGVVNGLDVKESCQLATTVNLSATYNNGAGTLTAGSNGALSIDGVTPNVNDRILVKDQSSAVQNGIYKVTTVGDGSTAFVLTRSPDADTAAELTGGTFFFVEAGSANADNGYVATHNGTPTFGSTNITFSQFSDAGQISAGAALSKTGNQLDVEVDDSSIEVSSDALQVKALGITNAMLAGSIANAKLSNSSISIGGITFNLGDTDATPALDLSDATSYPTSSLVGTIDNAQLAGSIENTKLSNSTVSIVGDDSSAQSISLGGSILFTGGSGITTAISGNEITFSTDGSIVTETSSDVLTNKTINGPDNTITNIANASLANSTITLGSDVINLGDTTTTITGLSLDGTGTIDLTGSGSKARFNFAGFGSLPTAATYEGMFAYDTTGQRPYVADAGGWVRILDENSSVSSHADVNITGIADERILIWSSSQARFNAIPQKINGAAEIDVTNNGSSNYLFDSHYSGANPTLYFEGGATYALKLDVSGHPFHLQTVSGAYSSGNAYTTGLTHIATDGTVTTGASALLKETGTLYYEIPSGTATTIYYACQYHSGMAGSIVVQDDTSVGGVSDIVDDTTPQLGGQLDVNGNAIGDGTLELLKFSETASAVNELTITNAATGNGPQLSATGDDTNIDLKLTSKGTGDIVATGSIVPGANDTYDLGASGNVWANIYTGDLNLSNEAKDEGNSVDGTKGSWTIQEGAEDLFLINNNSGKKYKFTLEEI